MGTTARLSLMVILWASTLTSYGQNNYGINGQIMGRKSGTLYLYASGALRQAAVLVDSVKLSSQFFSFQKTLREPGRYYLSMNEAHGQLSFYWDKTIVVFLDPDDLKNSQVEESPTTEAWNSVVDTIARVYEGKLGENREALFKARQKGDMDLAQRLYYEDLSLHIKYQKAIIAFIEGHREAWIGLFVLAAYHRDLGKKQTLASFSELSSLLRASELGGQLMGTVSYSSYPMMP